MTISAGPPRLAVILDPPEEGWTSMDYVGEMLVATLRKNHAKELQANPVQLRFPRIFQSVFGKENQLHHKVNRFVARCIVYPFEIARQRGAFDFFHIVDHSYAHAAHGLPGSRTGIYCHDLDALAPLLKKGNRQPPWRLLLARSILRAMQRAQLIFFSTQQVRSQILEQGFLDEDKLVHAPYGVAPEFSATDVMPREETDWLPNVPYILHVGSGTGRKRLELLFGAFAKARAERADLILVQQGAVLTAAQRQLVQQLGISSCFIQPPRLSRARLAQLYRHATLVVLPSEREGFGLPVVEALACGAPVLASDIPAFREVGGAAAMYCGSSEVGPWRDAIAMLVKSPQIAPPRASRLSQAARFSWAEHTRAIAAAYLALA